MTIGARHALVGDVGGTNARFAIADIDELTIDHFASFSCRMFSSLEEVLAAYLATLPQRPARACLAVAAPLRGETARLTNLDWSFSSASLAKAGGIGELRLVNDFEALASVLPHLVPHDLHELAGGTSAVATGPRVVLGPGTGLGMAGLVPAGDGFVAIASEGGHVTFPVETEEEFELMRGFGEEFGRVSAERMIAGPGIERVYRLLAAMRDRPREALPVAEIVQRATGGEDEIAADTLAHFMTWLGRYAGDMALAHGAAGGIYIAGGIAPRILAPLESGPFLEAFRAKGRMRSFMETVPVNVVVAGDAGLRGAALFL